ncbi:hypothetical protein [Oribacterium sp. WCC10]|uniref:hypothetical protein n=1 Tax=Oribacterium sp. WCC10 TaxID=1855343 RepID=UPI0008EB4780|nr:hypothetical protein [Oribacterium sp. WCC10]SFG47362.1 hypothetical protein SAMN05216356_1107 [Oribacterium sp. WCC10]
MGFSDTVHCEAFSALISSGLHVLHAIFCASVFAYVSIGNGVICRNAIKNIV